MIRPLAVFDIDGTLVDSRHSIHEASCEAARVMGLPEPDYERVRQGVGLSLTEAMRRLEPDLDAEALKLFVQAFQASFRRLYDSGHVEPLYDGVMDHLYRLKADGWRLALATGQNRRGVARNLAREGWAELFLSSHCAEDGPGKPDPAMLRAAMAACDAAPEMTVMIGDTAHDASMAVNAGATALGVGWGFHTHEEQRAAGVVHVASDFTDLEAALMRFASAPTPEKTAR